MKGFPFCRRRRRRRQHLHLPFFNSLFLLFPKLTPSFSRVLLAPLKTRSMSAVAFSVKTRPSFWNSEGPLAAEAIVVRRRIEEDGLAAFGVR